MRCGCSGRVRVSGQQSQHPFVVVARFHLVNGALLRADQRRQFGKQHLPDREQIALSLQHAGEFGDVRLEPILFLLRSVVSRRLSIIVLMLSLSSATSPRASTCDGTSQIAFRHRRGDFRDGAHLRRQICREQIHVAGQILPRARRARHVRLAAEPAFHAHFARDVCDLFGENRQRVRHVIDRFRERGDFTLRFHGQLLAQISVGNGRHDFHDAAHLVGQVGRHEVHAVGQILPRAAHAGHLRLPAEFAFRADFARHARHFGGEGIQLVHHGVDGVLQFQNFAFHVHRDFARQVAARHGRRHFGDVADLRRQVGAPWR